MWKCVKSQKSLVNLHDVQYPGHRLLGGVGIEEGKSCSPSKDVDTGLRILSLAGITYFTLQIRKLFM